MPRIFWSVFRISYFVSCIFWVSVLAVRIFPPKDGNYAREFGGSLAINALTILIAWAFVPERWWTGGPFRKTKAKQNTPPTDTLKDDLEEIHGRQGLEDFLEKRRSSNH